MEIKTISIQGKCNLPVFAFNGIIDDQAEAKKMARNLIKIMEIIAKALTAYYEHAQDENAVEPAVQNNASETTENQDNKEQETESANSVRCGLRGL